MPAATTGDEYADNHITSDRANRSRDRRPHSQEDTKRVNRHNNRKKKGKKTTVADDDTSTEGTFHSTRETTPFDSSKTSSITGNSHVLDLGSGTATPTSSARLDETFELRDVLRDDEEYAALFATTSIKPGTRLINEAALIALPASNANSLEGIYAAFEKLSSAEQASIMRLQPRPPSSLEENSLFIDALVHQYLNLYLKYLKGPSITDSEINVLTLLGPKLEVLCKAYRIAARFYAHRYSLTSLPHSERHTIPSHVPITGLFVSASYLQHSCIPNCHAAYNPVSERLTVHATRTIARGEQLTVSHIGNHIWYHTRKTRARLLEEAQIPECKCNACDVLHDDYPKHEFTRKQLHFTSSVVSQFLMNMDAAVNPITYIKGITFTIHPDGTSSLPLPPDTDVIAVAVKCESTIDLLKQTGCTDMELVRWRNALVNNLLSHMEQWDTAMTFADASLMDAEKCWGSEHPDVEVLREARKECERQAELGRWRRKIERSTSGGGKEEGKKRKEKKEKVKYTGGRRR